MTDAVGAIIAELKAQGVYNDTLIILTADKGSCQGEFGLAGKCFLARRIDSSSIDYS